MENYVVEGKVTLKDIADQVLCSKNQILVDYLNHIIHNLDLNYDATQNKFKNNCSISSFVVKLYDIIDKKVIEYTGIREDLTNRQISAMVQSFISDNLTLLEEFYKIYISSMETLENNFASIFKTIFKVDIDNPTVEYASKDNLRNELIKFSNFWLREYSDLEKICKKPEI